MNRRRCLWVLLAAGVLFFGCGGGRSVQAPPAPLVSAEKALVQGIESYREGCYDRSLEYLLRAHELYTAADERSGTAVALNNIGNVYRAKKETARSLLYYDAASAVFTEVGDTGGRTRALVNRASALIEDDRFAEAENALAAARDAGGTDAYWLLTRGNLSLQQGDLEPAGTALERALKAARENQPGAVSGAHFALARLFLAAARPAEAVGHAEAALAEDRSRGAYRKIADDLLLLGEALQEAGRAPDAGSALSRAMSIYALLGDSEAVAASARRLKDAGVETVHPLTVEFVEQWLKGNVRSNICR
jgi:tetratricopeptide (TPR) repeat protein